MRFRIVNLFVEFFFFKQKTAYEMRISDWSSDVCSSDLPSRRFSGAKSSINMDFIIEESRQLTVAAPAQYLGQDIYFDAGLLDGGGLEESVNAPLDVHDEALGRVSYSSPWPHVRPRRPLNRLDDGDRKSTSLNSSH